jgi:hypothetical protein
MASFERWCRATVVRRDGTIVADCVLGGLAPTDIRALDAVARLALLASRLDAELVLEDVSPSLEDLLDLSGLGVEMQGQAERREEAIPIECREEEVHGRDPTV